MTTSTTADDKRTLVRANPNTVHDKFLVLYDAEYTCPGDGRPIPGNLRGWNRWFHNKDSHLEPRFDLFPDVSDYSAPELFQAPALPFHHNEVAKLFSSRHPKTIQRHFHWMAKHSIDGAFVKRKAAALETHGVYDSPQAEWTKWRDDVGQLVEYAAEREGRAFAIMYDLTGLASNLIPQTLTVDWAHMVRDQAILDSSAYLREDGKAVILLSGFDYHKFSSQLDVLTHTITELNASTPGGVYVILSVPYNWRENAFLKPVVENDVDAISPEGLTPNPTQDSFDDFAENGIPADAQYLRDLHDRGGRKVEYMPTLWSGFSARNGSNGYFGLNTVKRDGGRVLWNQIWSAKRAGCRTVLCSSWDGYNNGSAVLPSVSHKRMLPIKGQFLALDADGGDFPPDWYMRVCGMSAEGFHSDRLILETFPVKELQDYWSTRPKYEAPREKEKDQGKLTSSSDAWQEKTEEASTEPPPPPYSLEASAAVAGGSSAERSDGGGSSSSTANPHAGTVSSTGVGRVGSPSSLPTTPETLEHDPHTGSVSSAGIVASPQALSAISPAQATTGHAQTPPHQQLQRYQSLASYPSTSSSLQANNSHSSQSYFTHDPHPQPDVGKLADNFSQQNLADHPQAPVWPPTEWGARPAPQQHLSDGAASWSPPLQHQQQQYGGPGQYPQHQSTPPLPSNAPQPHQQYGGSGNYGHIHATTPSPGAPSPPAPYGSHQPPQPYGGSPQPGYNAPAGTPPGMSQQFGYNHPSGTSTPPFNQPQHSHSLPQSGNYPYQPGVGGYAPPGTPPAHQPQQWYANQPQQGYGPGPGPHHANTLPPPNNGGYSPGEVGPMYQGPMLPPQQQVPYTTYQGYTPHPMSGSPLPSPGPGNSNPITGNGNFSLGIASNTIDRYAGEDVRRKIEKGADDIFKSGTKLFHKFTK